MKRLNWCIFFLIFPIISNGQKKLDSLYDLFFDGRGMTYFKPLTNLDFDDPKFRSHFTDYIDSLHYQQLVTNIKKVDSSLWTDQEAKNQILVSDDEPILRWEMVKSKFTNLDKKEEEWYKSGIDYYNKHPQKRLIYRVSRPIFDDTKELAVIQYRYYKDGYGIRVYKIKNGVWEWLFSYE